MVNFQMRSALQFHEFSSKMVNFQIRSEGCRAVSVGSPIRLFDPILNNALALRASHHEKMFSCDPLRKPGLTPREKLVG